MSIKCLRIKEIKIIMKAWFLIKQMFKDENKIKIFN
jgi:hypothetical protein